MLCLLSFPPLPIRFSRLSLTFLSTAIGTRRGSSSRRRLLGRHVPLELLTLRADHVQHALQAAAPHHQPALDLGPLPLAKDAVRRAVDEELGLELRQLALHQAGADGVDDPLFNVRLRDAQRGGNCRVWQRARRGGRGQGGEGQQTHLGLQGLRSVRQNAVRDRGKRRRRNVRLVRIQRVRGKDFQQLEQGGVAGPQRLHGIRRRQRRKVVHTRVRQRRRQRAKSQVARLPRRRLFRLNRLQSLHEMRVRQLRVARRLRRVCHRQMQFPHLLVLQLPRTQPLRKLRRQLRLERLERSRRTRLSDHRHNGQKHMVSTRIGRLKSVENRGEDGQRQRRAMVRRRRDRLGQVCANPRQKDIRVGRLMDKENKQIIRLDDIWQGRNSQVHMLEHRYHKKHFSLSTSMRLVEWKQEHTLFRSTIQHGRRNDKLL